MFERGFHPCGGWWELVTELIVEGRQFLSVYLKWKKRKVVVKDKDVESDDAKMSETTVWVADGCDDQAIDMSIASKIDSYILIIVNRMNERQSRGIPRNQIVALPML